MTGAWIINMRHYLDEDGRIASLPAPARRLADHFGAIVSAMSCLPSEVLVQSGVKCRRRPGRRPCLGMIVAIIEADSEAIHWQCPECGDGGIISGWEGSPWDVS